MFLWSRPNGLHRRANMGDASGRAEARAAQPAHPIDTDDPPRKPTIAAKGSQQPAENRCDAPVDEVTPGVGAAQQDRWVQPADVRTGTSVSKPAVRPTTVPVFAARPEDVLCEDEGLKRVINDAIASADKNFRIPGDWLPTIEANLRALPN